MASDFIPRIGPIDLNTVWGGLPLAPIDFGLPALDHYVERHDRWTEKIRIMGLDAGLYVDYRVVPGLDRLVDRVCGQSGWERPEIYIVSDLQRRGIDGWSAVSVISDSHPVVLLGINLVETLTELELAFVLGHEVAHLLAYNGEWRNLLSMSFLIREFVEQDKVEELNKFGSKRDWTAMYASIMSNFRTQEVRCDRIGLLVCGDYEHAGRALITAALRSRTIARNVDLERYLSAHLPLLECSPQLGPFSVNAGHPFVPYRLKYLLDFVNDGSLERNLNRFAR